MVTAGGVHGVYSSSVIGCCGKANAKDQSVRRFFQEKRSPNQFVGPFSRERTHYMYSVMPAAWHKDDSRFQAMLTEFGRDLRECFDKGVETQGVCLPLVLIGLKADLKFQVRARKLTVVQHVLQGSFRTQERGAWPEMSKMSIFL